MALPIDELLDENSNRYLMTVAAINISEQISNRFNAQGGQDVDDTEKIAVKALKRLFAGNLDIERLDSNKESDLDE